MKEGKKVKRRIWSNGTTFINKKKIYVRCVSYNDMFGRIIWTFLLLACRALMVTFSQMTGRRWKDED